MISGLNLFTFLFFFVSDFWADTPPPSSDNSPILPPPLPIKSRDLMPQDPTPLTPSHPKDPSPDSLPPLTRSGQARVSFREPISSSYSVEEDEEEEDENEEEERLHVSVENKQGDDDDDDAEEGGFGRRLNLQKGVPPQMDLLGKRQQNPSRFCMFVESSWFCFISFFFLQLDGSSYHPLHLRNGWGRSRTSSDPVLPPSSERRLRSARPERPHLDTLDLRGGKDRDGRSSCSIPSLSLQQGRYKHGDSCSTCSSSSESEEEGFFLGQRIPLPPQLRQQQPDEPKARKPEEGPEVQRDRGLRGSIRRRRALSHSGKDKDKNCAVS